MPTYGYTYLEQNVFNHKIESKILTGSSERTYWSSSRAVTYELSQSRSAYV